MSNVIISNLNLPASEEIFCPCSETAGYALMSFSAAEKGSAVSAGQLPQAWAGIGLRQRQEPFLLNQTPQPLQNQTLKVCCFMGLD